ncbi:MAG: GspE/PulE family protein [Phycisphaerales bacterium]
MLDATAILVRAILEQKLVSDDQIETARAHAVENGVSVPDALVALNLIQPRSLCIARAAISECPYVDLEAFDICIRNAELLPRALSESLTAFPIFFLDNVATVALADPLDFRAVDQVRQAIKTEVEIVLADPAILRDLITRAYSLASSHTASKEVAIAADLTTGDEPIVAAVNQIIATAVDENASDIHINPDERALHLRYRIDGSLVVKQGPPLAAHAGIVQRLKVLAALDLTQTRKPQDGKFRFNHRKSHIDVRLSTIPTVCGENVVMRLLRPHAAIQGFDDLGMPVPMQRAFETAIHRPHGMILVTGPTGSGKTTTLYTALNEINTPDRNIMTIEDPVEIRLPLVRQTQVNPGVGLTFAAALRSILRQDPDVVLLGEIRDEETAQIAVQASLTGHLVLSTLHTNDAPGAVPRLRDFNVPSFAINSSLLAVLAQRLVRRVCKHCAQPDKPNPDTLRLAGIDPSDAQNFVRGAGCPQCNNTGYRGRVGVYELLTVTPAVQRAIAQSPSPDAIAEAARAGGFQTMAHDGIDKARQGLTTLEEISEVLAFEAHEHENARRAAA